jgi:UDP-N-acetylglucosamine--N-acetylmuramyl-(pentapeptide) pyrophosphoryl-undecaprenol N-acetylglucosamine transferase
MTTTSRMPHIVFTGGGTGGHLFPGLAVAERLREAFPRLRITFAGGGKPWERDQVTASGFDYLALPCRPWPRRLRDLGRFVVDNAIGYRQARRFLGEQSVAAVVGLGGYTSGPMARAAIGRRIPLVLLEQNVTAGRVNRWLAPRAALVCTSFAQTGDCLPALCRVVHTGNPIRSGFTASGRSRSTDSARQLLILGGSGGARSLNEHVPRVLAQVRTSLTGWQILHQTGPADAEVTRELYRSLGLRARVAPFLADMPGVLASTGLAICRAGGTTLAELAAAGVPAILVPYPYAANNHQRLNADVFAAAGGGLVLDDRDAPGQLEPRLVYHLPELLGDCQRRTAMAHALKQQAKPDAAREVARLVAELARLSPFDPIAPRAVSEEVAPVM